MVSVLDEFRDLLNGQPKPVCMQLTPCVITSVEPANGFVRLGFAEQPAFRNHFGNIQGGFAVAMLDVVVSIAAYAKVRAYGCQLSRSSAAFSNPCQSALALVKVASSRLARTWLSSKVVY